MTSPCYSAYLLLIGILYFGCHPKDKAPAGSKTTISTPVQPTTETPVNTINLDKSPLDLSYYPVEYPKLKMTGNAKEELVARVIYSRPKKEGRIIFGNVLKFGSRWRLGANEATEIEFFKDVTIQKKQIKKNRYIIYCIPYENKWTLILNNDLFTWGLKIDSSQDAYKFDIPVTKTSYPLEVLSMSFEEADPGINLVMAWDSVRAVLSITY
jgi:hypothetical protein